MDDLPEIKVVSARELREMHNNGRMWERALLGLEGWFFRIEVVGHPSAPMANEPFCTESQILAYCDDEAKQVARVHRYLRTDGSMGASGQPDPKEILGEDGILYVVVEPPEEADN
jgi:hypothetical protein